MRSVRFTAIASIIVLASALAGCANMNQRDRNTALGAGLGAAAGAVLSGGSTSATLIGAAAGGVLGNQFRH